MSLKLDLAGAAAEASQQGLSSDLWKGGATNQTGAYEQVSRNVDALISAFNGNLHAEPLIRWAR